MIFMPKFQRLLQRLPERARPPAAPAHFAAAAQAQAQAHAAASSPSAPPHLGARSGVFVFALLVASAGVGAADVPGPSAQGSAIGPVGTVGPLGRPGADRPGPQAEPAGRGAPARTVQPAASPAREPVARGGNRIEVTGNTATGVPCQGAASVNSIDVAGARLDGRTVIVQGRNARGVDAPECAAPQPNAGAAGARPAQTNSIRIR